MGTKEGDAASRVAAAIQFIETHAVARTKAALADVIQGIAGNSETVDVATVIDAIQHYETGEVQP